MIIKLIKKQAETSTVKSFYFTSDELKNWQAGQYIHYKLPHANPDSRGEERWFTIASAPSEGVVQLSTRYSNPGSSFKQALADLELGSEVEVSELGGDFVVTDLSKEYIFIAGGIGITPFRAIINDLAKQGDFPKIHLLFANSSSEIPFQAEFEVIAQKYPQLSLQYLISPEQVNSQVLQDSLPNLKTAQVYISGPEPMVEAVNQTLVDLGLESDHIKKDWFPGYQDY